MNEKRISDKVATSFLMSNAADTEGLGTLSRRAKVFDTKEELAEYLKSHPKADKSKHSVGGGGGKPKGKKEDPKKLLKQQDKDDAEKTDREDAENQALSEKKQKAEGKKAPAKKAPAKGKMPNPKNELKKDDKLSRTLSDVSLTEDFKKIKTPEAMAEFNKKWIPGLEGDAKYFGEEVKKQQAIVDDYNNGGPMTKKDPVGMYMQEGLAQNKVKEYTDDVAAVNGAVETLKRIEKEFNEGSIPGMDGGGGNDGPTTPHGKKSVGPKAVSKVENVMSTHSLSAESDEMKELAHFKSTLGQRVPENDVGKWYVRNVNTLKADFIKNMSPGNYKDPAAFKAAQERLKKMPAGDFAKILAAITDEEGE